MITAATLLSDLSDDPIDAFNEMIARVKSRENQGVIASDEYHVAVIVILKFAERHDVTLKRPNNESWREDFLELERHISVLSYQRYVRTTEEEADREIDKLLAKKSNSSDFAFLTADEKSIVASKVESIRKLIEESLLETKKKNTLFRKLSKFLNEAMCDGTNTDSFFAFVGELSFNAGLMAKNAKPAIDEAKEILKIVMGNRAKRDGIKLEKPEETILLPSPDKS